MEKLYKIRKFLPFHMLYVLGTKHIVLCVLWLVLLGMMTSLGQAYGIPQLLLQPEIGGEMSFWSFFIVGLAFGLFVLSFQMYCYVNMSHYYSFLATVRRPFLSFSVNNSALPILGVLYYLYRIVDSALLLRLDRLELYCHLFGLVLGIGLVLVLSLFYFFNITRWLIPKKIQKRLSKLHGGYGAKRPSDGKVLYYYMTHRVKLKVARCATHYPEEVLDKIYKSLHTAVGVFSLLMLGVMLVLGALPETMGVTLPAGATIFLLFLVQISLLGFIHSWFHATGDLIVVLLFVGFNWFTGVTDWWKDGGARGLNYAEPVTYSDVSIREHITPEDTRLDSLIHIKKMDRYQAQGIDKLVIVSASGGGLRATIWTYTVLNAIKEQLGEQFGKSLFLMTGSSGGNFGNFLFREELSKVYDKNEIQANVDGLGKNLLNNLGYNWVLKDATILKPIIKLLNPNLHDRGWCFEQDMQRQLPLKKHLSDYTLAEQKQFPIAFTKATVVNDGRTVFMSATPSSFMSYDLEPLDIDFQQFFGDEQFHKLQTQSVLRMSATFPYTMPFPQLPTQPVIEVADGGARDNSAMDMVVKYLRIMAPAIKERFREVVYVEINSVSRQQVQFIPYHHSLLNRLVIPLDAYVSSLPNIIKHQNTNGLMAIKQLYGSKLSHITFDLFDHKANLSMSWYLSKIEKDAIKHRLSAISVQKSLNEITRSLDDAIE